MDEPDDGRRVDGGGTAGRTEPELPAKINLLIKQLFIYITEYIMVNTTEVYYRGSLKSWPQVP